MLFGTTNLISSISTAIGLYSPQSAHSVLIFSANSSIFPIILAFSTKCQSCKACGAASLLCSLFSLCPSALPRPVSTGWILKRF